MFGDLCTISLIPLLLLLLLLLNAGMSWCHGSRRGGGTGESRHVTSFYYYGRLDAHRYGDRGSAQLKGKSQDELAQDKNKKVYGES